MTASTRSKPDLCNVRVELAPDLLVIYHGINDIHDRIVWPSTKYRADNSGAILPTLQPLVVRSVWEEITFLRYFAIRLGVWESQNSLGRRLVTRPSSWLATEFSQQYGRNEYPTGVFAEVSVQAILEANDPRYFRSNLESMIAIASARDIEVVLVTFAHSPAFAGARTSSDEYRMAYDEHNQVLKSLSGPAHVFDFAAAMPDDEIYYTDGRHFTALGNKKRAELLVEFLLDQHLVVDQPGRGAG